ncbi:MAG: hypothetical protein NUV88_03525 [Candidatus Kaiserbacteria bacterium]|nr:hypothetical protein [Candidatus Kaiserbacteria bacterium]
MNQNKIIGGIVLAVILVWGIWYFSSSSTGGIAGTQDETATTTVATGTAASPGTAVTPAVSNTFRSIFTQSGNHECLYEQVTSSGKSSSRIYIADGKMRGEFRTISGTTNTASLMIYNGGILYSWKEGATTGRKSTISSMAELPDAIPNDLTSGGGFGVSLDNVSWDCHDWAKDPAVLVVPTYVKF